MEIKIEETNNNSRQKNLMVENNKFLAYDYVLIKKI
jgi:hypothetical protein